MISCQWHFYSQLIANENGFGAFAPMVNWDEVKNYKQQFGKFSLPRNNFDYLRYNKLFLLKRIPISLFEILIFSIRYVGLLLLVLPYYVLRRQLNQDHHCTSLFPIIITFGILAFVFIIPHLVEHRFLFPFYLMLLYYFDQTWDHNNSFVNNAFIFINLKAFIADSFL